MGTSPRASATAVAVLRHLGVEMVPALRPTDPPSPRGELFGVRGDHDELSAWVESSLPALDTEGRLVVFFVVWALPDGGRLEPARTSFDSELEWLERALEIERSTRGRPRAIVAEDLLARDWSETIHRVSAELTVRWPVLQDEPPVALGAIEPTPYRRASGGTLVSIGPACGLIEELCRAFEKTTPDHDERLSGIADRVNRDLAVLLGSLGSQPVNNGAAGRSSRLPEEVRSQQHRLDVYEMRLGRQEARSRELRVENDDLSRDLERAWEQIERQQTAIETLEENVLTLAGRLSRFERSEPKPAPSAESLDETAAPPTSERHGAARARARALGSSGLAARFRTTLPGLARAVERRTAVRRLRASPWFDSAYYRQHNPDIGDLDPAWHYVHRGALERRDPHPLFDTSYYLRCQRDVAKSGANPLAHFIRRGIRELRDPTPLFDSAFYLKAYADVAAAGLSPFEHFLRFGIFEGRLPLSPEGIQRLLEPYAHGAGGNVSDWLDLEGEDARDASLPVSKSKTASPKTSQRMITIAAEPHEHGGGGLERQLARMLHEALRRLGVETTAGPGPDAFSVRERGSREGQGPQVPIVIAPHRYRSSQTTGKDGGSLDSVPRTTVVNTAAPGSRDFVRSLPWLFRARRVFDIDYQSAAFLRDTGLPALFLPVGPLEGFPTYDEVAAVPDEPATRGLAAKAKPRLEPHEDERLADRPLDITFTGSLDSRRETFVADNACLLGRYDCFIHLGDEASEAALAAVARRSKIVVHVHAGAVPRFDWHRLAVLGLWQRSLVLTERCYHPPGLEAGKHFLEAERAEIPGMLRWLLDTSEGKQRAQTVATAGHRALSQNYGFTRVVGRMLARLDDGS